MSDKSFDIDEWLAGAIRVTKFVEVYGRAGLQADIDALDAQIRRRPDEGGVSDPERVVLARKLDELRAQMSASRIGVRMTSVPPERIEEIIEEHGEGAYLQILAEQIIEPEGFTAERLATLQSAIGEGYFAATLLATSRAAQQGLGVEVPFSSAASRILSAQPRA